MIKEIVFGFIACVGFGFFFNCPKNAVIKGSIAGAIGWLVYTELVKRNHYVIIATFIGAIVLSIICEICARLYKDTVTSFALPAILPLVPGAGLYYTMFYFIQRDYDLAANKGVETLGNAVAIAIALLIVSSLTRLVFKIIREIKQQN